VQAFSGWEGEQATECMGQQKKRTKHRKLYLPIGAHAFHLPFLSSFLLLFHESIEQNFSIFRVPYSQQRKLT